MRQSILVIRGLLYAVRTATLIGLASLSLRPVAGCCVIPVTALLKDLEMPPFGSVADHSNSFTSPWSSAIAQAAESLVRIQRPRGPGNPSAVARPARTVNEVPDYQRERTAQAWARYYHQQQVFYTDAPVCGVVIDHMVLTAASNLHGDAEIGHLLTASGTLGAELTLVARHVGYEHGSPT